MKWSLCSEHMFRLLNHSVCMLGNFSPFFLSSKLTFSKNSAVFFFIFFKIKFFQNILTVEYNQSVKQFESRSGPTLCWA